jgi:hypothetical protein
MEGGREGGKGAFVSMNVLGNVLCLEGVFVL